MALLRRILTASHNRQQTSPHCRRQTAVRCDQGSATLLTPIHVREDLEFGGARRNRTDDLFNAIEALSQLSYGPTLDRSPIFSLLGKAAQSGNDALTRAGV